MIKMIRSADYFTLTLGILIFGFIAIGSIGGCNNGGGGSNDILAILVLSESGVVPGRLVADASKSATRSSEIVSYEFTVRDEDTGETVAEFTSNIPEQSTFTPIVGQGTFWVTVKVTDNEGHTDTARGPIVTSGNCVTVDNVATCCVYSNSPSQYTCVPVNSQDNLELLSGGDRASLVEIVSLLTGGSNVTEDTVLWIQAWGGGGGNGSSADSGLTHGGIGGTGRLATTITTISDLNTNFGTTQVYYFVGHTGTHSDSGGSGGASSIVAVSATPTSIDDIVVISGGGGGAGAADSGNWTSGDYGSDSTGVTADQTTTSASAQGENKDGCIGGGSTTLTATGGSGACGDGSDGIGGEGGPSAGAGPENWLNGDPGLSLAGSGGSSEGNSGAGAGGGGFGGGGAGGDGCDDVTPGCGGGSVAQGGSKNDNCAPENTGNPDGNNDGQIYFVFNTDPNSC